ncbi:hypothetical protein [Mesorhizobium sp. B1-1-5]|uniref:hypothetical protein n=1 Tax=Mesorhizobium sp. B1-1-5 TaxID=2589979 RepID=UPI0015E2F111|nr:hypothetical protein [Mesorhizobium sp. B1-1-5]
MAGNGLAGSSYLSMAISPLPKRTWPTKNTGDQGCCGDLTKLGYGNSFFLSKAKATAK